MILNVIHFNDDGWNRECIRIVLKMDKPSNFCASLSTPCFPQMAEELSRLKQRNADLTIKLEQVSVSRKINTKCDKLFVPTAYFICCYCYLVLCTFSLLPNNTGKKFLSKLLVLPIRRIARLLKDISPCGRLSRIVIKNAREPAI